MRTVTYFTKKSPASFFMEGKKVEQGKFSFVLGNSKPQKIPLVTPKMQPMTSLPQGRITSFFYVSCNYDNCIN
jgi:hypothetical protein